MTYDQIVTAAWIFGTVFLVIGLGSFSLYRSELRERRKQEEAERDAPNSHEYGCEGGWRRRWR
jgi:hypothetical protein